MMAIVNLSVEKYLFKKISRVGQLKSQGISATVGNFRKAEDKKTTVTLDIFLQKFPVLTLN